MMLSCVIPATDSPPSLARSLEAVQTSVDGPDEIEVVADAGIAGAAAARNAGVAATAGEVIAFVDADVVVHPDAFERIRAAFRADPELDAVFGAYDDSPADPGAVSGFRNLLHHRVHVEGAGPAQTFWTGLGAVRRSALERVGGFDAEWEGIEDIDLGMRIAAAGGRIRLDPAIRGMHLKRWTLPSMVETDLRRRGIPWARMILERRDGAAALNLGRRGRTGALATLAALVGLLLRRPRAAGGGLLALALSNLPLFALIARRRGALQAAAALPLLALHHLTAIAAAAIAAVLHLRGARDR